MCEFDIQNLEINDHYYGTMKKSKSNAIVRGGESDEKAN